MNVTSLLLANGYLCCWMLFYYLAFSRRTSFRLNRTMLLSGIVISFILPFIALPSVTIFTTPAAPMITTSGGTGIVLLTESAEQGIAFPVWEMMVWIYWLGVVLMGLVFLWKLFRIMYFIRKFPHIRHTEYIHVQTPAHWEVFSFMNYLFAPAHTAQSIIEHEKVHIRQKHSIDNLFIEIVKIFCWFNPAIYLCQKALKMGHEYLADASTIKIVDVNEYAHKLVNQSFKLSNLSLVHPFLNRSHLQKRLIMLQKKGKHPKRTWTYLLLLPALAGIALFASSFSLKNKLKDAIEKIKPAEETVLSTTAAIMADTSIEGIIHTPSNQPVAGANVIVGQTQQGTVTNDKGHFKLAGVAPGTILHISSIGYNAITIRAPRGRNNLDIVLYPKPESLNKLSVTGYVNKPVPPPPPAPSSPAPATPNASQVFQFVEQMPAFPGGEDALMRFLRDNVRYPAAAREAGIQGTVVVQFVVEKDGTIKTVTTLGKNKGGGLEEEAMRVVRIMPKWHPGKQNGQNVRVQYSLPIRFKLSGPEEDKNKPIKVIGKPGVTPPTAPTGSNNAFKQDKNNVYQFVADMPSFPGGEGALMNYLRQNIKYPAEARKDGIYGTIVVQFIVQKDGSITNIKTRGKKKGGGLEEESMRVVKNMPKWIPGKQNDKPVNVQFSLPIRFQLQ